MSITLEAFHLIFSLVCWCASNNCCKHVNSSSCCSSSSGGRVSIIPGKYNLSGIPTPGPGMDAEPHPGIYLHPGNSQVPGLKTGSKYAKQK